MKNALCLILLFLCACFLPQYGNASGNFAGTVTDSLTGLPIPGALVVATKGNQSQPVTAEADGTYEIININAGNYTLVASKSGYRALAIGGKIRNDQTTVVDFALVPDGGTISGTVTNAMSVPISGASVEIFQGLTLITTATTNGSGAYSAPDLAPGIYIVNATATSFQTQSQGATVQAGVVTVVDFALAANPGAISGTVTDALTTDPIEGALVQAFNGSILIGSTATNGSGNYTISDLAPGSYVATASADGYRSENVGASVTSGVTTTADFALAVPPGTIAGTVTDASTGSPIPGASIKIYQELALIASVLTDPNGQYSISEFTPGNYAVVASAPNFNSSFVGTTVTADATTTVNFALSAAPGTISGTVINAGTSDPIVSAEVQVRNEFVLIGSAITDLNGSYSIPNLEPNTYSVTASTAIIAAPFDFQSDTKVATVSSNETTVVVFALNATSGNISGTVTDSGSTDPIPGATVAIFQGTTLVASALTDANGDYTVLDLAIGDYIVLAIAEGYRAAFSTETVIANMTTTADFALNPIPGTIAGVVISACTGGPVPGALITVLDGSTIVSFGLTDTNGAYSLDTLAPGDYTITVNKSNFFAGSSPVTVVANTTATVNFSLEPTLLPPASISGGASKNKFLTQIDLIFNVSWTASPSACVTGYQIFRNGTQIAFVSPATLTYQDHNRNNAIDTYSVKAVNSFGLISTAANVTIGPMNP